MNFKLLGDPLVGKCSNFREIVLRSWNATRHRLCNMGIARSYGRRTDYKCDATPGPVKLKSHMFGAPPRDCGKAACAAQRHVDIIVDGSLPPTQNPVTIRELSKWISTSRWGFMQTAAETTRNSIVDSTTQLRNFPVDSACQSGSIRRQRRHAYQSISSNQLLPT